MLKLKGAPLALTWESDVLRSVPSKVKTRLSFNNGFSWCSENIISSPDANSPGSSTIVITPTVIVVAWEDNFLQNQTSISTFVL